MEQIVNQPPCLRRRIKRTSYNIITVCVRKTVLEAIVKNIKVKIIYNIHIAEIGTKKNIKKYFYIFFVIDYIIIYCLR